MNIELKPCPFCGFVEPIIDAKKTGGFYGYCLSCFTRGPIALDRETATALWNTRGYPPEENEYIVGLTQPEQEALTRYIQEMSQK